MLAILLLALMLLATSSCHHIVFIHNFGTKSHLYQLFPLVEELLDRGNTVTGVFYGSAGLNHPNYTEILVPNQYEGIQNQIINKFVTEGRKMYDPELIWWGVNIWYQINEDCATQVYGQAQLEEFVLRRPSVQAVVTMLPFGAPLAHVLDAPIIQFSPTGPFFNMLEFVGNELNPSVQPYLFSPFIEPLTFVQRFVNHFLYKISCLGVRWFMGIGTKVLNKHLLANPRLEGVVGEVAHVADIMADRTALLLSCSHPVTHGSWQYSPNIIEVGGLHLKEPSPLPDHLQHLLDSSTQGVMLVSFGSTLSPSAMGEARRDMFLRVFRSLPVQVIWKWDGVLPQQPPNVHVLPWLPQLDLLNHPNLRLFVTHGGLLSLVEALDTRTPLVGIPFANDQRPNLLRAQRAGYAVMIDWADLTEESLRSAIEGSLFNSTMASAVALQHTLFTDRPHPPRQTAAWWVEYVARQGVQGGRVLRSIGTEVPWWQLHHWDLILALAITALIIIASCVITCKCCYSCCCSRKVKLE